ncbi:MAG: TlpA disulfide reductase family protein [Oxalicibacterium faecigallinarum]|uniref:TlpA disulfide reductase family protein n=1 Tax=Oxalicibacterium faecigallinarum TaxID=573741 RepID=UPI00280836B1|nr:TlpA disulfide reductase family protein [Oxalicibacterium faecigallinarum]MDQ7969664.1 TlpA disulfide reductase family protein [Oxalicibacterium faecigallinarum]
MQDNQNAAPRKRGSLVILLLVVAVIAMLGYAAMTKKENMPDVTFTDLQGNKITSQDLRGKVTILNFWATSCVTCVKEMPDLVATYNKFNAQGLELIAVAMSYDPPNYVLNFVETRQLPFTISLDPKGKLAQAFGDIKLTPTTLVVDKQGQVIARYVGEPDFAALHRLLEKALAA